MKEWNDKWWKVLKWLEHLHESIDMTMNESRPRDQNGKWLGLVQRFMDHTQMVMKMAWNGLQ